MYRRYLYIFYFCAIFFGRIGGEKYFICIMPPDKSAERNEILCRTENGGEERKMEYDYDFLEVYEIEDEEE